ncbi:hypothetical protein GGS24DRAFT_476064 [Hypoxylon argillaceum]|nr:hypothetical protein GGS24DRAFT_476064 [Hypoxylon argillaceum]
MRSSFYERRRMPHFQISARGDGSSEVSVPAAGVPVDDELSDDELTTDDEFSDEDISDDELSDDEEDPHHTPGTPPPTSSEVGITTTISSQSIIVPVPTTNAATTTTDTSTTPLLTTSKPAKETATASTTSPATTSSTLTSSRTIPVMTTNTLLAPTSTRLSSSATTTVSTSAAAVLNPGDLTTSTSVLSQSTSSTQAASSTGLSQPESSTNPIDEKGNSTSNNSQRAGQIAGGVIGSIAFIGLALFAVWMWRRRRQRRNKHLSRMSEMPANETQYPAPQPRGPGPYRTPSSIMNQMMTAVYAAEDGRSYRDSSRIFDNYSNEKQASTAHENESTERLTMPSPVQLRPPSIAARTETTNRTESTWKTWGVLAGSSQLPAPRNWWVDRYLRT